MPLFLMFAAQLIAPDERAVYVRCLNRGMVELEVSGERPRDVASAVIEGCRSDEPRTNIGPRLMVRIRQKLETRIAATVVELRACRKRKSCNPKAIRIG